MKKVIYLIDFDGTISISDSTTLLGKQHNHIVYEQCIEKFHKKDMNIKEYVQTILENLKIDEDTFKKTLQAHMRIDHSFSAFINSGIEFRIVSSGADKNIIYSLEILGYKIPKSLIFSNRLIFDGCKATLYHPYQDEDNGVDKTSILKKYRDAGYIVAFIGDGLSDLKCAPYADVLFAKKGSVLAKECERKHLEHIEFSNFKEIVKFHNQRFISK